MASVTIVKNKPVSTGAQIAQYTEQQRKAQQSQANAIAQAQANIAAQQSQAYKNNTLQNAALGTLAGAGTALSVKPDIAPSDSGNGGGGGGVYGGSQSAPANDPYAGIYSIYGDLLNAQRDALSQQRQANINKLQANYNNAKSQLDSSFASGEASLNQNADEALREAFVNNKLQEKAMAQYLASQGIVGGAAESIIANLYNTYGNNRNSIEKGRANNLRDLLSNYQGTLGDIENTYLNGMANADADYSSDIANALTSYYGNLADLQKQNIANQYKTALGKSGTSSKTATTDTSAELNKTITNGLKNFKDNLNGAKAYLTYMGVPETEQDLYLWNAGFDMSPASLQANALSEVPSDIRNTILSNLKRIYPTSAQDGLSSNESLYKNVIEQLNRYALQYGLTDAQAQALLAEAGF